MRTTIKRPPSVRRGYALPLTLIFVVLFAAMLGVAWRGMAAALRVQSVHTIQAQRDQGSIHALARAMYLLETGLPPTSPYVCVATVDTSDGQREYMVTFVAEGGPNWSVRSEPINTEEEMLPMPDTFADKKSDTKNDKNAKKEK